MKSKLEKAEAQRRKYNSRKDSNCCVRCGCKLPVGHDILLCSMCREKDRSVQLNRHMNRRNNGLCITCGEPVDPGVVRCSACRKKHNRYNRLRYQKSKYVKEI